MQIPQSIKRTTVLYAAQITNLILGWVVAKLNVNYLSVSEYGQFTFFLTVINVIFIFFTLGTFEAASRLAALSEDNRQYRKIAAATISITFASYLLFTLTFWLSQFFIDRIFEIPISQLIGILFPLAGIYLFVNMWQLLLRGSGRIYHLSAFIISPRVLYIFFIVLLIYSNRFTLRSTAFAHLISIIFLVLVFTLIEKPVFHGLGEALHRLMREIRQFGIHLYWSELIKVFLYHSDKLLISFFLNAEALAYYSLAFTITFPISFFSTALSTSLYKKFSTSPKIDSRFLIINSLWIAISVILFILFRNWIILGLFSPKYAASLIVFPYLAVAFGIAGLSKLYSYFLTARGAGAEIRNISIAVLIVHLSLNLALIPRLGTLGAAFSAVVTYIFDLLISIFYYNRFRKRIKVGNNF
jgi:O-antigen/teichoic acid export membrane protein